MFRELFCLPVLLAATLPALAQVPAALEPKTLTLRAAASPVPALKYRLLPEMCDLEPGNALTAYLRAHTPAWWHHSANWEDEEKWQEMSLEQLKKEKVGSKLPSLALQEVDRGARREYCDWELSTLLRRDGFPRIPEVQDMRQFTVLLQIRARCEMAEGHFDKALFTLQTVLAMSRHVGDAPLLIHDLVACAIAAMALESVHEFIQQPGAPNLYWALAALPRPFIDIRKALEGEKIGFDADLPEFKKLEKEPFALSEQELARLANFCCGWKYYGRSAERDNKGPTLAEKLALAGKVEQRYPAARKALIDRGHKAEKVDAMPMLQVVLIENYRVYRQLFDDQLKWACVPYWEGHAGREQVAQEVADKAGELMPFHEFLPAWRQVHFANVRTDRRIAALRCIEGLRLHLAQTGKLPKSLEDVVVVPIPVDPVTGKHFQYTVKGDVVTLWGPAPPGMVAHEGNVVNYRITIKR